MERAVAIKKLGKILGKSLGYRVDMKAPDRDDRDEARAELRDISTKRAALKERMEARRAEILRADAEYQQLKVAHADIDKRCGKLSSISNHYRVTVGVSNGMFFNVKAQGDSWEDVISKLTEKKVGA